MGVLILLLNWYLGERRISIGVPCFGSFHMVADDEGGGVKLAQLVVCSSLLVTSLVNNNNCSEIQLDK